jgi:hypothetical protein
LQRLRAPALGAVLDLDSTVFERYGHQQGSLKGYNPRKHGRPSHHPLLAMLAEAKVVLHAWLRSGNTASARGVKAFLAETLAKLPPDFGSMRCVRTRVFSSLNSWSSWSAARCPTRLRCG